MINLMRGVGDFVRGVERGQKAMAKRVTKDVKSTVETELRKGRQIENCAIC